MQRFGTWITINMLWLPHTHNRLSGIKIFINQYFAYFINRFTFI